MKKNKKNRSFTVPKFTQEIGVLVLIISAVLTDSEISHNFLCLDYLYSGIKYSILAFLFTFLYYCLKKSFEMSFILSLLIWIILNFAVFAVMYNYAMKKESFITPPCEVTSYLKKEGKSGSHGINYIYKGDKHHLHYTSTQLDSLADLEGSSQWRKIDLRLKLNKVYESVYYIDSFTVSIKE